MSLYFAYGSNLGPSIFAARCPAAVFVGAAVLDGFRVAFTRFSKNRGGGVADVVASVGSHVWGSLYEVTNEDLERLDEFEGTPHAYQRETCRVRSLNGEHVSAWIYSVVMKRDEFRPSRAYWRLLVGGAAEAGLPAEYRAALEAIPYDI